MSKEPIRFLGTVYQGLHEVECPTEKFPPSVKMPIDAQGHCCSEDDASDYMIYHYRNISGQYCYVTGGDTERKKVAHLN